MRENFRTLDFAQLVHGADGFVLVGAGGQG